MNIHEQIDGYISGQPGQKGADLLRLHRLIIDVSPDSELWFLDGRDGEGRIVSNPNIGYGRHTMTYAHGGTREFYRLGLSANTAGLSLYVMGLDDKTLLAKAYGPRLGKAKVTGYCVKFRSAEDIDLDVFETMIRDFLPGEAPRAV
jgi:hypothetical protein